MNESQKKRLRKPVLILVVVVAILGAFVVYSFCRTSVDLALFAVGPAASSTSLACTFGLGPDSYDGVFLITYANYPGGASYRLQLTCDSSKVIELSFDKYTGPFRTYTHDGWRLLNVKGHWGTGTQSNVFFVTSIEGWVQS
jgi:hypothetical protein